MANKFFPGGKKKILDADIDLLVDTIKVALVKAAYSYSAAYEFYSDVSANVISTPQTLANRTTTNGVFDADDVTFPAVTAGDSAEAVIIYKDTGVAGTSALIAMYDSITNFPFTTNGADIVIQWDSGSSKIFAI